MHEDVKIMCVEDVKILSNLCNNTQACEQVTRRFSDDISFFKVSVALLGNEFLCTFMNCSNVLKNWLNVLREPLVEFLRLRLNSFDLRSRSKELFKKLLIAYKS